LIALVQNSIGELLGVHRTFLGRDGAKTELQPPKASLGPIWGGAIRLDALQPDTRLVIGEGVEAPPLRPA
jgi:putative DNA primase/helicase